jgi:transposase
MSENIAEQTMAERTDEFERQIEPTPTGPEVLATPKRRRFSAKYKRSIVVQAERCSEPGEIGALLRREGLYSSQLSAWRRQSEAGELAATSGRKRGPASKPVNPLQKDVKRLERENRALQKKLKQAELIIEFQKKFAAMLETAEESERQ